MISCMIRRTLVEGLAYAALDLDTPGTAALAVAWKADDGWRVAVDGGRTVATGLSQTRALNQMHRSANEHLNHGAVRDLLTSVAAARVSTDHHPHPKAHHNYDGWGL